MYLRRITVTGFKSFANKTVLDLEPGITGVVGPNGSGKSNIADAIRWALGEQSKSRLRLSDREEVVFAGSDKRAKASFAEVVLLFNNEDGAFPLDMTEVEISRRLYRSGEGDYRLAGRSVRLGDIQALLAQAGFGAGSYMVIGQGMIDNLLMSSPAERKLLFDEAAGIRGPELGREAAMRKLAATEANLTRLRDIMAEIAPRLAALRNAAVAQDELQALKRQVTQLRQQVVAAGTAHWGGQHETATEGLRTVAARLHELQVEAAELDRELSAASQRAVAAERERAQAQAALIKLERERDDLAARLGEKRGALAEAGHHSRHAQELAQAVTVARAELDAATARRDELQAELGSNAEAQARATKAVDKAARDVAAAQAALVALRQSADDGSRDQYLDHALQLLKTIALHLDAGASPEQVRLLVHKAGRLLSHATRTGAAELLSQVKAAQKQLEAAMTKRETAIEHQTNITITGRSLEIDLAYQQEAAMRAAEHLEQVEASLRAAEQNAAIIPVLSTEVDRLTIELKTATASLDQFRHDAHAAVAPTETQAQVKLATRLERTNAAITAAEQEQSALKAQLAESQSQLEAIRHEARSWGLSDSISSGATPHPKAANPEALRAELVRAEAMLEARSAAARDQAAELAQVDARHTELEAQIADLEQAKADLEKVVTELDAVIRSRFKENFQALAGQFSTYFARLFEGGSASLDLTEAEDGSYGIAIRASPAGKRLASIAALSGGERALAGVALLAAILRVNPSPFVVLDEIDAALDEANSGRLASILTELSEHSQLIVITHNRQTMKTAHVLFGVTMNEHHVSHLLSMRLEEATAIAAR